MFGYVSEEKYNACEGLKNEYSKKLNEMSQNVVVIQRKLNNMLEVKPFYLSTYRGYSFHEIFRLISKAESTIDELNRDNHELKTDMKCAEGHIESLSNQIDRLTKGSEVSMLRGKVCELESKLEKEKEIREGFKRDFETLRNVNIELVKDYEGIDGYSKHLEIKNKQLKKQVEQQSKRIDELNEMARHERCKRRKAEGETEWVRTNSERLRKENKKLNDTLSKTSCEKNEWEEDIFINLREFTKFNYNACGGLGSILIDVDELNEMVAFGRDKILKRYKMPGNLIIGLNGSHIRGMKIKTE